MKILIGKNTTIRWGDKVTVIDGRMYNSLEVISMDTRKKVIQIIEGLSDKKLLAALYILELLASSNEGVNNMADLLNENNELLGSLKVAESAFSDWDNEDDAVYDKL